MKKSLIFINLLLLSACLSSTLNSKPSPTTINSIYSSFPLEEMERALVTKIVDGDSIKVLISGAESEVRYIGIDTPEMEPSEWYGNQAKEANAQLVEGKEVLLEKDISETDRFDRLLRYVYLLDGTFVNAELVRMGYAEAKAYPPDTKYQDLLEAFEQEARRSGIGIWQLTPTPES